MKFCAIICEYNPLHKMHERHIAFAREVSGCDFLICLMSGNFVQRGQPAVLDRFTRAKHALYAGADIVIELPLASALSAADDFASGATRILQKIGVESLSFGCESGDADYLKKCAEVRLSPEFDQRVGLYLERGISYPSACGKAFGDLNCASPEKPNDILAVGYMWQCGKLGYSPEFYPLKREEGYNDLAFSERASSSALRYAKREGEDYSSAVPDYVYRDDDKWINLKDYEDFVYRFLRLKSAGELKDIYGVSEGLENRITSVRAVSYEDMFSMLKTKRYTESRIRRVLLNCVLGFTSDIMDEYKASEPYSRLLGMRKEAEIALKRLNPLFTGKPAESVCLLEKRADAFYEALSGRIIKNYPVKI